MIRIFLFSIVISIFLAPDNINGQTGTIREGQIFSSDILGKEVKYSIYFPSDYNTSERSYPVVYLLHGFTDDETGWIQFGEAHLIADRCIEKGEIPPMIIVMPDGGVSFYINDYKGEVRWEDMFINEFIPFIDRTYRTRAKKEFRGISGLSMGGYGTLFHAMKHPGLFVACAAFSSGIKTDDEVIAFTPEGYNQWFAPLYGENLKGEARLTNHWKEHSILNMAETLPAESLKSVRYYIDCGDDDFLAVGNSMLHIIFSKRGITHEYRVREGKHEWSYWRTGLPEGLKFIGESFHR